MARLASVVIPGVPQPPPPQQPLRLRRPHHLTERGNRRQKVKPLLERVDDWKEFVRLPDEPAAREALRLPERTPRPLGSEKCLVKLERLAGWLLRRQKPGPKKRQGRNR